MKSLLIAVALTCVCALSEAGVPGGGLWGGQSAALGQRHERHGGSFRSTLPRGSHRSHYGNPYGGYPMYSQPMYYGSPVYGGYYGGGYVTQPQYCQPMYIVR